MIVSIRHKGLRKFYETGNTAGVVAQQAKRLRERLTVLEYATTIDDINRPGFGLHPLQGNKAGRWSLSVSGNWRLHFEFIDGDVYLLDYEDYH
jgi:toxin HigB-1